jgi:hypothetical protein
MEVIAAYLILHRNELHIGKVGKDAAVAGACLIEMVILDPEPQHLLFTYLLYINIAHVHIKTGRCVN